MRFPLVARLSAYLEYQREQELSVHSLRLLCQLRLAIFQHFVAHVQNNARNR